MLKEVTKEDIQRNFNLIQEGKEPDISLAALGADFKMLMLKYHSPKRIKSCKLCKEHFLGSIKQRYCSKKCFYSMIKINRKTYYISMKSNKEYRIKRNKTTYLWKKKRMQRDKYFLTKERLRCRLRRAIREYSKGKVMKPGKYIDYPKVINHLGPCPGNRREWNIDHIKPLCHFNYNKTKEIKKSFEPSNLRWLPAKENIKKSLKERRLTILKS